MYAKKNVKYIAKPRTIINAIAISAIQFVIGKLDNELKHTTIATGLSKEQIFAQLYATQRLSPYECQKYLEAQSELAQHFDEIFSSKESAKKSNFIKTKKLKI